MADKRDPATGGSRLRTMRAAIIAIANELQRKPENCGNRH
jgi:hypothetical protein